MDTVNLPLNQYTLLSTRIPDRFAVEQSQNINPFLEIAHSTWKIQLLLDKDVHKKARILRVKGPEISDQSWPKFSSIKARIMRIEEGIEFCIFWDRNIANFAEVLRYIAIWRIRLA